MCDCRSDLARCDQARCFQVVNNQLTSLPPELGLLTNLKTLDVRHSRHTHHDLTCFQVAYNQLTSLPAEIGQLTQLVALAVRNRIEWIVI